MRLREPHSKVIARELEVTKNTILSRFKLSEAEVNEIIFTEGIGFLEYYFGTDHPEQVKWITRLSQDETYGFWPMFMKHWRIRDRDFIAYCSRASFVSERTAWIHRHMKALYQGQFDRAFYNWLKKLDKPI